MASSTSSTTVSTTPKKRKKTTGVLDYLRTSLPRETLLELYTDESRGRFVCRSILQTQLSDVAQQIVMRLSCCGGAFPVSGIAEWVVQKHQLPKLLKELKKWAIIQSEKSEVISLTKEFNTGVQGAIQSLDSSPWMSLTQEMIQQYANEAGVGAKYRPVAMADLERDTQEKWDAVLHFLVGTPNIKREPAPAVVNFLLTTKLMQHDPDWKGSVDRAPLVITTRGYDFMLQDNHQQVWHFVVQYLQSMERHKKAKELLQEAMLFLISLSFAKVGDAYASSSLSKRGRTLMKDLSLFGLLYVQQLNDKISIFYPTQVALQLVHESSSSTTLSYSLSTKTLEAALADPTPKESSHLAVVVQTNFQLCAYTTSELHVSMLGLFCDVDTIRRLPNVVFMIITRDSVKSAFHLGIEAQQILRFLEKNSHPKLRGQGHSPIPQNVEDQIWLWHRELRRVEWDEVYKIQCHNGLDGEFEATKAKAIEMGAFQWSADSKKELLVNFNQVEELLTWAGKWRAKVASGGNMSTDDDF